MGAGEMHVVRCSCTNTSPWLEGILRPEHMREIALFETNRGCPFKCEFCYWGGAVGAKVNRQDVERLKEEISYIASHGTKTLVLCDANFGILPHDVELAEHIARVASSKRSPSRVTFSSAKNRIDRVEQIAKTFAEAGLLSNQAISLQSMSPRALALAKRDNIKTSAYLQLQQRLNELGVPSFVELIWPLPGETLESFKQGVDELCRMGAQSFSIYPLLWLNNVGYESRGSELDVTTLAEDDPLGGGQIVIRTREVGYDDYVEGLQFATAVMLLHTCRGLYATMLVLDALRLARFRDVLDAFVEWMQGREGNAIATLWRDGRARFENMAKSVWRGYAIHSALHGSRVDFDRLLSAFVADRISRWAAAGSPDRGTLVAACAEFDLLTRPYLFVRGALETEIEPVELHIVERRRAAWRVRSPYDVPAIITKLRGGQALDDDDLSPGRYEIEIDHRTGQTFRLPSKRDDEHYWHAQQAAREIVRLCPRCTVSAAGG